MENEPNEPGVSLAKPETEPAANGDPGASSIGQVSAMRLSMGCALDAMRTLWRLTQNDDPGVAIEASKAMAQLLKSFAVANEQLGRLLQSKPPGQRSGVRRGPLITE